MTKTYSDRENTVKRSAVARFRIRLSQEERVQGDPCGLGSPPYIRTVLGLAAMVLAFGAGRPLLAQSLSVGLAAPTSPFSSQAGTSQSFTFSLYDSAGIADMNSADLAFGNTADSNICYLIYFPNTHTLSLNADSSSTGVVSGNWTYGAPGVTGTINNSQCSVNLGASAESYPNGSGGTTVNLTAAVTFNAAFAGGQPMAGVLYNNTQVSSGPWTPLGPGVWDVIAPGDAVSSVSVSPSNGSGLTKTFTLQYSDTAGATAISTAWVWFNAAYSSTGAPGSCMVYYASATNQLFFLNDAGTAWSPATPGAAATLSNSSCSMNAGTASVTSSGTNLTLNLPMTFTTAYTGVQNVFLYASGSSANSGWDALGQWNVSTAAAVSVTPSLGSGSSQTFALNYSDSLEATDLASVWVWFTANFNTASSANSCMVYYASATNQLFFLNDAGTAWSPATPGAAATLSNSSCSMNA
ncbi:MAG: hypothetical protein ABSG03_33905, partial [Bryobacteraceae bacterium]